MSRPRELLEDLVQGVDAILWEMDPSAWRFTFVSDHAVKLLGYPLEDWLTTPHFWENVILHPSDREWATEFCRKAISEQRAHTLEYRAQAADGRVVWLRDRVRTMVDAHTERMLLRGVMVDVTDRRHVDEELRSSMTDRVAAEAALAESEERYRRQFQASPVPAYMWRLVKDEIILTEYNHAAAERSGGKIAALVGSRAHEMYTDAANAHILADLTTSILQKTNLQRESDYKLLVTGETRHMNVTYVYVPPDTVVAYADDVTEARSAARALAESESRYRKLVESSPDVIAVHSEGRLVFMNTAGARLVGAAHPDEMIGRSIIDFMHPDSRESTIERVRRVLETGESGGLAEERFIRLDGSIAYGEVTSTRTVFNGKPAVQVVIRDVTRRHETEEALRASQSQLQQAQKMEAVGRLAGGVAHDFNNLLTAIIGNARLVLEDLDPDSRMCEDVGEILSSAEKAAEVTRQLLAFSRKQVLLPRNIDLNDVVAQMDLILRRLIGEHIQLITELNVIRPVRADPGQISQVILNLVVNARDAIGDEGFIRMRTADIELSSPKQHLLGEIPPGSYVVLSVSDTGTGIREDVLQNIFEPFFTTKPEGKGTGLGLSTVYGVVTQSGGYVGVDSKPDAGTKFSLYFPSVAGHTRN